jgi:molybdate transport system substrate-binding protein
VRALVVLLLAPGCGRVKEEITVSVAMSLKDAMEEIKECYPVQGVEINLNFGASSVLQHQIEQGAPVDIFIAAAQEPMNELEEKGLIEPSSRRNLLANELVLIAPKAADGVRTFEDLLDPGVEKIAIGDPQVVPAGNYARETLVNLKLWDRLQKKLIFTGNVRQVLHYTAAGDVDAGMVYLSDAVFSKKVRIAAVAPKDLHQEVIYPVAITGRSRRKQAALNFISYLTGPEAAKIFARYGFSPLSTQKQPYRSGFGGRDNWSIRF